MRKCIIILGMHRSGTSAITRGLQVLGVELGNRLIPPTEGDNAKGFWEDIDLNALNIEILSALNSDWHHLAPIEPGDVEALRKKGYFLRAVELLRQKVGSAPVFGFKDPRVAKLLPFWKEVFSHCQLDVSYVLTMRHPFSVAKSLAKRDGFDAEKSYLLWLGHVITSLSGTAGGKRIFVDYDILMQSPDHELNRIAKCLDLKVDPRELQNYKTEFLDEGLRHTVYDLNDLLLDDACPPLVREIYAALLDVASDKARLDDLALQNQIAHWIGEFERLKSPLTLVDRLFIQGATATQAVTKRDGQIIGLTQAVAERDGQITSLTQAVAERDGQITSLNQAVAKRDGQITSLNQAVAERDGQIASLNQAVAERDGQIANLNQAVAERDGQIANLIEEQARQIQVKDLHICNIESELNMIKHSRVWRLAEFFRSLVYQKILGPFPLLQQSALTISRAGFPIFIQKAKRRLKRYLWRFKDVPSASETSPSETAPLKTMNAKTYVRLGDFQMKADREVIKKTLRVIIEKIEKKRGV